MGNAAVRLEHYTAEEARRHEDEIVDVAADAYADRAANPFNRPDAFRERLHGYVTRPGFHLVMAREDDRAVGLTFGFQLPPDTKWFAGLQVPLPDDIAAAVEAGDVYALSEIMTRTTHRGQGIAHQLHDALLATRPERYATLLVRPDNTAARTMYEHLGWTAIGQNQPFPPDGPTFNSMTLELH
jgi:ribosomal protein S18 acetylase RimI-like enzyme